MKKLLLPIDSGIVPEKLLAYLKELVPALDYEVTILNIIPLDRNLVHGDLIGVYDLNREKFEETAKIMLDTAEASLRELGIVHIEKMQMTGDPAQMIVRTAEKDGYHLIAMCTHGMGATKRLLIGSVTNKVVHHSEVPVLVVR
jgi:nucleotide-binding universal stress UspA family protein